MSAPWRRDFDAARDPYTARNALGITTLGGGGGAPTTAEYVTSSADATLTNERVLTDTASITWDFSTAGQAKANAVAGGGNVSNSGTPTSGQWARWVTSTTIEGVSTSGPGIFSSVTYIQRLNTTGGLAPAGPGSVVGETVEIPYTAEYYFYREQ